jgi:hypothetical protein
LPDGLFSNQKSKFGLILEGLLMENLGIFYDHLVYFTAIANILGTFGIFCGNLVYLPLFWYFGPRKIWQPCSGLLAQKQKNPKKLPWRHGLVVSSPSATDETGAIGREVESRLVWCRAVAFFKKRPRKSADSRR